MKRRGLERAQTGLTALRNRPPFRPRATQVRVYDARGQARSLDPHAEPGRTLVGHAEELVRVALGSA